MTLLEACAVIALILTTLLVAGLAGLRVFHEGEAGGLAPLAVALVLPLVALVAPLDLASASSPWRISVALLCFSLALFGAFQERWETGRAYLACVIVVAWNSADGLAPFTWALRGPYIGSLLCLGACFAVVFVLTAPERWTPWARLGSL